MSFIEMMVYLIIFVVVVGFVFILIWGGRQAETGRRRLGIFQDLRLSSQKLNLKLGQATRILFPPPDGKPYHQIVFLSEQGELIVLYLNEKENLFLLNYDGAKRRKEKPSLLSRRTLDFIVSRPVGTEDYVQYFARILDDKNVEFALTDGITVRNIIR
mgnify:CR=1 FL=1